MIWVGNAVVAFEAQFTTLNDSTNTAGWARTLNYSHPRLADGTMDMLDTAEGYVNGLQVGWLRAWTRMRLDWVEPHAGWRHLR